MTSTAGSMRSLSRWRPTRRPKSAAASGRADLRPGVSRARPAEAWSGTAVHECLKGRKGSLRRLVQGGSPVGTSTLGASGRVRLAGMSGANAIDTLAWCLPAASG
jgi:hypothetical protein